MGFGAAVNGSVVCATAEPIEKNTPKITALYMFTKSSRLKDQTLGREGLFHLLMRSF